MLNESVLATLFFSTEVPSIETNLGKLEFISYSK